MISYVAPTWSFMCPDDGDLGKIVAEFMSLIPASSSMRIMIYGWTDPQVYESAIEAQNRGVDGSGLLDHTQSAGPVENRNLTTFFTHIKRFDSSGKPLWVIGTSDVGDQIIHAKSIWANWTESNSLPYKNNLPSFTDWRDFVRNGYPTVLRGSYNWSTSASKQVNTMDITPSPELCNMYQTTFNRVKDYNLKKNMNWNMPTPSLISPEYTKFIPDE